MLHFDDLKVGDKFRFKGYPQEHIKTGYRTFYGTWEKKKFSYSVTWEVEPKVLTYRDLKAGDWFKFTYSEYKYIKTDNESFVDLDTGEITDDEYFFLDEEVVKL